MKILKLKVLSVITCMTLLIAILAGCASAAGSDAPLQKPGGYPDRPIRLILPVAPGGGVDTSARQWQKYFEQELGVALVFESHEGAGTLIGNRTVAEADPDGYTLGLISSGDFIFSMLTMDAPYTADDFTYLGTYYSDQNMLWVHKDQPWNTMREFTDYVKTQPSGTVPFSIATRTSPAYIQIKNLEKAAGVEFNIVAFNGGNPARMAVASKEVEATIGGLSASGAISDTCKVIGCMDAINTHKELTNNAMTIDEEYGTKLTHPYYFYGLFAPKAFEEQYPDRYAFIVAAFERAINNPNYKADLDSLGIGFIRDYRPPEAIKPIIDENTKLYAEFVE